MLQTGKKPTRNDAQKFKQVAFTLLIKLQNWRVVADVYSPQLDVFLISDRLRNRLPLQRPSYIALLQIWMTYWTSNQVYPRRQAWLASRLSTIRYIARLTSGNAFVVWLEPGNKKKSCLVVWFVTQ